MADSLCGPSNALQSFQKHSTVDRTLQQDRLTSRHAPSQGFRSTGPSAGMLDSEFEAFQAGQIPLSHPEGLGFAQGPFPNASQQMQQPGSPSWANDFQRMNISSPPPPFQQQSFPHQAHQSQMGGWHQEFSQQEKQHMGSSSQNHLGYNAPLERLSSIAQMPQMGVMNTSTFQPYSTYSSQMLPGIATYTIPQQSQPMQAEAFDEEAFARAFDEAAQAELLTEQASEQEQSLGLGSDILMNESAERFLGSEALKDPRERIGADLIHDPDQDSKLDPQQQNDPDALARTAGQLLNSVRDNQSSKFQNSTFLELMRQLRDKEVTVEGDKIVDIGTGGPQRPMREIGTHALRNGLLPVFVVSEGEDVHVVNSHHLEVASNISTADMSAYSLDLGDVKADFKFSPQDLEPLQFKSNMEPIDRAEKAVWLRKAGCVIPLP